MPNLNFDISGSQIDGARDYQEDAFLITHLGDGSGSLVIVADGMGGHAAGNVASNMAVQTFNCRRKKFSKYAAKPTPQRPASRIFCRALPTPAHRGRTTPP